MRMKKIIQDKIAQQVFASLKESKGEEEEAHILSSLIKVLKEKKELPQCERIMYALQNLFDYENHIIKAHIIVQERLSPQLKQEIKEMLKKKYDAENVIIKESIDERIIGGIKIRVGEEVYDATLAQSIKKLQDQLSITK